MFISFEVISDITNRYDFRTEQKLSGDFVLVPNTLYMQSTTLWYCSIVLNRIDEEQISFPKSMVLFLVTRTFSIILVGIQTDFSIFRHP